MTKRCVLFSIMMIVAGLAVAQIQTQLGYTKTIGKPDKPGVALSGVEVRIDGNTNTVLSNEKGSFSFPVNSKQFKLSRAKKNGYELADPDLLRQSYGFTNNTPFVIPFVSTEELRRIKNAIEDQTRQKLEKKFAEQNALLESLKDRNKLSEEEFGIKLTELETKYNDLDTLVQKLADRYARTDYDNIDSTRLLINQAIEQGDVERAIQLIKSKGDIADRLKKIEEKENRGKVLTQMGDQQLQEAQAEKDELAADLKQLAEYHYDQHYYDSAYFCMEQRYLLDTMSVVYLYDLVFQYPFFEYDFSRDQRDVRRSCHLNYLHKLNRHISELGTMFDVDTIKIGASLESQIANLFRWNEQSQNAINHYRKAYSMRLQAKDDDAWEELESIGRVYESSGENENAFDVYHEALSICKSHVGKMTLHIRIADLYNNQKEFDKALKEYILAEKTIQMRSHDDMDEESTVFMEVCALQGYIALLMEYEGQQKKAVAYGEKAINNARLKYERSKRNNDIFPIIALYKQQYNVYCQLKDFKKMLHCAEGAVNYTKQYMQRMPSSKSRLLYAEALCLLADVHAYLGETDLAKEELIECLKNGEFASNVYKYRYVNMCYSIYNTFAKCYTNKKQYSQALQAIEKAISTNPNNQQAYQRKFDILHNMGKKDDALVVEQRLVEIQKNNIESRYYSLMSYELEQLYY